MFKFGFELEAFCFKGDDPVLVPSPLPFDECGWLIEVRSEPHTDPFKAMKLLEAEKELVEAQATKLGLTVAYVPFYEIPRDLKVQAARRNGKGLITFQNIYGHETHRTHLATASLHISVTNTRTIKYRKDNIDHTLDYPGFIDHAKFITTFDRAFKVEIKAAKRNPGFYEVKGDGRIEYRSLPNTVDLRKVVDTLKTVF